jgi:hypothetical protein
MVVLGPYTYGWSCITNLLLKMVFIFFYIVVIEDLLAPTMEQMIGVATD